MSTPSINSWLRHWWTLKTEGYTRTVILLKVGYTAHFYYWFRLTAVYLDDSNGTFPFQHVCMVYGLKI